MNSERLTMTAGTARRPALRGGLAVRLLVLVALLAAGIGLWMFGSAEPVAKTETVGGNLPVDASAATDKASQTQNNSPSAAVNPRSVNNVVVVNRIDNPRFSCAMQVSVDGGASWRSTDIPFPDGEEAPPRCYAPDVAFDSAGTLFVSFATLKGNGNVPNALWLVSSQDGGRTLSPPIKVLGPLAFQARLMADPSRPQRLYLTWLQADSVGLYQFSNPGNPVNFARSDDGGQTWQGPVRVSSDSRTRVVAPAPAVGPGGVLYVSYLDLRDDSLDYHGAHEGKGGEPYGGRWSLVVARSADAGATWRETEADSGLVPTERFIVFIPPSPSLAVDPREGSVYVTFHDGRSGDADVWLWTSRDGAVSFGRPQRINDTRARDGTSQYLPKVAVAPSGRVDMLYLDRRTDAQNVMNEVSLQSSTDGGRSFGPRVKLTDTAFDSRLGFGVERDLPDLGSRLGLVSTERWAVAFWPDTRAAALAPGSLKQDLTQQFVAFSQGSDLRSPLRLAGVVALGGALLVIVLTAVEVARNRRRVRQLAPPAAPALEERVDGPGDSSGDQVVEAGESHRL